MGSRLYLDIRFGKCSVAIPCDTLCKTEEFKNFFRFAASDMTKVIHNRPSYHSFNQQYFTAISRCVDKYSEKLEKRIIFSAFQSAYPLVRMTDSFLSDSVFLMVCGTIVSARQRSAEHDEGLLTGRAEQF